MAQHKIVNSTTTGYRYTVTGIAGNPDCTGNQSTTVTKDVPAGQTVYVDLDGPVIKSVNVTKENIPA